MTEGTRLGTIDKVPPIRREALVRGYFKGSEIRRNPITSVPPAGTWVPLTRGAFFIVEVIHRNILARTANRVVRLRLKSFKASHMETHIIHSRFWHDEYIVSLTREEKLFFLFLLTNEYVNVAGVYELPRVIVIAVLGYTDKEIEAMCAKFQQDDKFRFHKSWVKIVNFNKYRKYKGATNVAAIKRIVENSPQELFSTGEKSSAQQSQSDTASIPHAYPIDASRNKKLEIINKKKSEIANGIDTPSTHHDDRMEKIRRNMGWSKKGGGAS